MKLNEAKRELVSRLASVTDEAALEAELILEHFTGASRAELLFSGADISPGTLEKIEDAVQRRLSHEPLQYILGEWGFMGLEFYTRPGALIPRQDTETLCEEALRLIAERDYKTVLDICTGTGCIAVSIAKLSAAEVAASDISRRALELARKNAERNGADITFFEADLFDGLGKFDLIAANPPYIAESERGSLSPEVLHEPELALFGGPDGLDIYRRIAAEAAEHMEPGGALLLEVGLGQAEAVRALFPENEAAVIKDLNGVERVVRIDR